VTGRLGGIAPDTAQRHTALGAIDLAGEGAVGEIVPALRDHSAGHQLIDPHVVDHADGFGF